MSDEHVLLLADVGPWRLAFAVTAVEAVLPLPRLSRPPGATPLPLVGFADVGGRATAVIAPLALLTGEPPPSPGTYAHLLLLADADPPIALIVDRAIDVLRVSDSDVRPVGRAASANGWLVGEIGSGETVAYLVDPQRLLVEAERRRLLAIADGVAAREAAS